MKKVFSCGHRGKGRVCQRCAQERGEQQVRAELRAERQALAERLNVRVGQFPNEVLVRAGDVLAQAQRKGTRALRACGAKKINANSALLSVRIGRDHRMVFRTDHGSPQFLELLTHASYDSRIGQYH